MRARGEALALAILAALAAAGPAASQSPNPKNGGTNADQQAPPDVLQPTRLPPLPRGMTLDEIRQGDALFHGKGGCFACHGANAQGLPAAGDAISVGLSFVQSDWRQLDSLVTTGIPDALTRRPIHMPGRGARGDLTAVEIRALAAYVWAISQTQGEPWPGGHTDHSALVPAGSTSGTSTARPWAAARAPTRTPRELRGTTKKH